MNHLRFLIDSYQKSISTKIESIEQKGNIWHLVLTETVFYPEGGGQPSDQGEIKGEHGTFRVTHCRMVSGNVLHEGTLEGNVNVGDQVVATIDWHQRYYNMRKHTAGHIVHDAATQTIPMLIPLRGQHGKDAFVEYQGSINPDLALRIEKQANLMIIEERAIKTEFVSFEELKSRAPWVPEKLPRNKPLRIVEISGNNPMADGGTQLANTKEIGEIRVTSIENSPTTARIHYDIAPATPEINAPKQSPPIQHAGSITLEDFQERLQSLKSLILTSISQTALSELGQLHVQYFGASGAATKLIKMLKELSSEDKKAAGMAINEFKKSIEGHFASRKNQDAPAKGEWFDVTQPAVRPPQGHLHIVSQAIMEITRIFERIGFTRVRYPEVDWDWYPFESLNMPASHPARDEWETFFIEYPGKPGSDPKKQKMVLTPHTSNGQVREMEKGQFPIRMINIVKCYRRQSDVSHVPMFHQFEGLYIDRDVSIGHLKGVFDFFVKQFYGPNRTIRLRPYHFQFTEPSFEVDISCGVCNGKARLPDGQSCKLCKEGWLELGGAGMVHPVVLQNGGVDMSKYNGFAFGWGVERTYMMKAGTQLDDIRLLYSNDVRFLEQF